MLAAAHKRKHKCGGCILNLTVQAIKWVLKAIYLSTGWHHGRAPDIDLSLVNCCGSFCAVKTVKSHPLPLRRLSSLSGRLRRSLGLPGAVGSLVPGRGGELGQRLRASRLLWSLHSHHQAHWLDQAGHQQPLRHWESSDNSRLLSQMVLFSSQKAIKLTIIDLIYVTTLGIDVVKCLSSMRWSKTWWVYVSNNCNRTQNNVIGKWLSSDWDGMMVHNERNVIKSSMF